MKEKIARLRGHIIVCGYGRVGREVSRVFQEERIPFVVIDYNSEAIAKAAADGYLHLVGNATNDYPKGGWYPPSAWVGGGNGQRC